MICLIPARSGSKRVPKKNSRLFLNRPMISWAIQSSLASGLFRRVVVSTNDEEIAEVSMNYGAEVPFIRPIELADDVTPTRPVVIHAIEELDLAKTPDTELCIRYPTTPLLRAEDLRAGVELLHGSNATFVFSAVRYGYPIQRALHWLPLRAGVDMVFPEHRQSRSQDLETTFHDAGQFYMGKAEAFLSGEPTFGPLSRPYFLEPWRAIDIDEESDWVHAELIAESLALGAP